ncbi:MAG TPA: ABC transporter permease subunit [Geminicoccaceae bacterium]|nr:ABC transporter permease subunit [Geminicoccaceae bacterium]
MSAVLEARPAPTRMGRRRIRPTLAAGTLIGSAVITETVFAIPGAGRLMIESIYGRDYPVVQGLTLALAILVSLVFLVTDLVQAALDPRIGR